MKRVCMQRCEALGLWLFSLYTSCRAIQRFDSKGLQTVVGCLSTLTVDLCSVCRSCIVVRRLYQILQQLQHAVLVV